MILRACVVIPTFNNPRTISNVVSRTLRSAAFPVLVVDDGSEVPVEHLVPAEIRLNKRLTILRGEKNLGKGLALQRALQYCVAHGFTHMITLDGDGQHFPEDISVLAAEMKSKPWNFIFGFSGSFMSSFAQSKTSPKKNRCF